MRLGKISRTRWGVFALVVTLIVWGLTDVRGRGRMDPDNPTIHRTDVTVYTGAGAAMFDGRDPYAVASPRGWHYLYPPLFAIFIAPLASLDPRWQSVALYAISVLASWACYVECRRLWTWVRGAQRKDEDNQLSDASVVEADTFPVWILWVTGATILLPVLNCLQRGQLGMLMLYPLLLGFRWAVTSRTWADMLAGGIVLALPAAIKLTPALPVAFVCWQLIMAAWMTGKSGAWGRAVAVSGGVAAGLLLFLIGLPSVIVGPAKNIEYLQTWVQRVAANDDIGSLNDFNARSKRNQSLTNAVYRLGSWISFEVGGGISDHELDRTGARVKHMPMDRTIVSVATLGVRALLLVLLFVAGWSGARNGDRLAMGLVAALACLLTLVVSPLSWGHYYMIWLPAAALAPLWLWQHDRKQLAAALTIAACGLVWAHYLLLPWAGRMGLLGFGTTVWFTVVAVALVQMKPAKRSAKVPPARESAESGSVRTDDCVRWAPDELVQAV